MIYGLIILKKFMMKNLKNKLKLLILITLTLNLIACNSAKEDKVKKNNVSFGEQVFNKHCSKCHNKKNGNMTNEWQRPQQDGNYAPPPLDKTGTVYHHQLGYIMQTISEGGTNIAGKMPAFKNILTSKEKQAVIDYVANLWSNIKKGKEYEAFKDSQIKY